MKYVHAAFLAAALVASGCAFAEDGGVAASSANPNVTYRVMTSPSASDVGTNSNYPLDPAHSVAVMSSPSANDVGTNSNYPLDPKHMVAIDNSTVVMPNNDGPVQSANSMSLPVETTTQFAGHRTQPAVHGSATNASPNG
jgi:hypothetical protein